MTKSPFLFKCPHMRCPSLEEPITEGLTTMYVNMYKLSTCSIHRAIFFVQVKPNASDNNFTTLMCSPILAKNVPFY